jgi:hypothetical protein
MFETIWAQTDRRFKHISEEHIRDLAVLVRQ